MQHGLEPKITFLMHKLKMNQLAKHTKHSLKKFKKLISTKISKFIHILTVTELEEVIMEEEELTF